MSEHLKIETGKTYFITMTIVDWVDLFTRECYVSIFINSIKYCQQNKGLEVYAYVIMPSHVHMIIGSEGNLSHILRNMKEHTSKLWIKEILENPQESRREWLLEKFTKTKKNSDQKSSYKIWQEGNYPEELFSIEFINQKENYIHQNPVTAGIVTKPEFYRLSSASEDSPIQCMPIR